MSRLPIRVRLTATFAIAMVLVLAGAGLFVYLRLKSDLDESVTAGLSARATAVLAEGRPRPARPAIRRRGLRSCWARAASFWTGRAACAAGP